MGSLFGIISEELPKHTVLSRTASYEIRCYAERWVASTPTSSLARGGGGDDDGGAFRRLASYIGVISTPLNESKTPIAMTSPVLTGPASSLFGGGSKDDGCVMNFVLPSSLKEPPKATGPNMTIRQLPASVFAASRFSGVATVQMLAKQEQLLREALLRDGVKVGEGAKAVLARYNPPWTPAPLRTNEVLLPVDFVAARV